MTVLLPSISYLEFEWACERFDVNCDCDFSQLFHSLYLPLSYARTGAPPVLIFKKLSAKGLRSQIFKLL